MAALLHKLLHLMLLISAASAWYLTYRYYGGSITFTPKGQNPDGTYQVELRNKQATYYCNVNGFHCYYGDCGTTQQSSSAVIAQNYYHPRWCQQETVITKKLSSNLPFAIRYPTYRSTTDGRGYWMSNYGSFVGWRLMTHIDLGVRSDTGEPNRSPSTAIIPVLRVTRNCPRSFSIPMFDADGDRVRCRVPTSSHYQECTLCGLTSAFSLDQNTCTLQYKGSYYYHRYNLIELIMEDFPQENITLSYSDGSSTSKLPLMSGRRKRQLPAVGGTFTSITSPTTIISGPSTITTGPSTVTAAPTTISGRPTAITGGPSTYNVGPTTISGGPTAVTAAPTTISGRPITTTVALSTITGGPATTTAAVTTITGEPTNTAASTRTTTSVPITITGDPTNTIAAPTNAMATPTTISAPSSTTAEPSSTSPPTTIPTIPFIPSIAPLSKVPVQFMVHVDYQHAPSCLDGDYFPLFLSPTPSNGAHLHAFLNQTLEIRVRSTTLYTMIHDLLVTGPKGIYKQRINTEEYVIKWTPTENELNDHFPICFISEAKKRWYQWYHSELRCVTVDVQHHEATVTCNETTMTVEVEKSYLIRQNEEKLHLNAFTGPSCNLTTLSNSSHLVAIMFLDECGTVVEEDDNNIIFTNDITSADVSQIISREEDVDIALSCVYPKRSNLTLGFRHKNPYAFTERGFGTFKFQFEFFESQRFRTQKDASTYPLEVSLKQRIFMQIEVTTSIPNIELFVESCRATPYDDPNSRVVYTIIQNGCVKDDTVQIYPSSRNQFRFGMEAFEFIGAHEEVYISCSVLLCERGVPGTRCSQGCISSNHRAKREAAAAQTSSHSISQGPLHLLKMPDSRASGSGLSFGFNLLFIVGCVLVVAVVIYRSRASRAKYQRLPTSEMD